MKKKLALLTNQNRLCKFLKTAILFVQNNFLRFYAKVSTYKYIPPYFCPGFVNVFEIRVMKMRKMSLISFRMLEESEVLSSSKWVRVTKTTVMKLWWVIHSIIFFKNKSILTLNYYVIIHDVRPELMTSKKRSTTFDWFLSV